MATTYPTWEYTLLDDMGGIAKTNQLVALNLWAASEGLSDWANNWLAITDPGNEFGVALGLWNPQGVVTFATVDDGASAIANFIKDGPQYAGILAAFADPKSTLEEIYDQINMSGWNDGHVRTFPNEGGVLYPVALYDYLLQNNDITAFVPITRPGGQPTWAPTTPTAPGGSGASTGSGFFIFFD